MAITPQSYPFSGGAFMGGGGTEVHRDDIHSLVLTKDGETIGNYNPLTGDTTIDIPKDAVMLGFDPSGTGVMSAETYQKMHDAIDDNQCVVLESETGGSATYWQLFGENSGAYRFASIRSDAVLVAEIFKAADASGSHQIRVSTALSDTFHSDGGFNTKTSVANTQLELFSADVPRDGVYIVSLLCHIRPTTLAGSMSDVVFSIVGPEGVGLPNTTRSNLIDDSDDYDQPVEFTVILRLKAGTNSFRALFTGAYTIFGDRWSVTSL
jgi:hypothetical protein